MKRILFFSYCLVIFFFAFASTQAQIKFEPKAGVNLGFMNGNLFSSLGTSQGYLGFQVGMKAEFTLLPIVNLHAEALYTRTGDTREKELQSALGNEFNTNRFALSYFSFPVGATYSITNSLNLTGGIYSSILQSASLTSIRRNASGTTEGTTGVSAEFETVDYGAFIGVGYKFLIFNLELRYTHGFKDVLVVSNILTGLGVISGSDLAAYNRTLTLSANIVF